MIPWKTMGRKFLKPKSLIRTESIKAACEVTLDLRRRGFHAMRHGCCVYTDAPATVPSD